MKTFKEYLEESLRCKACNLLPEEEQDPENICEVCQKSEDEK